MSVVAPDLPVGARLHQFWETWEALWAGPKVIRILREGYSPLPEPTKPNEVTDHHKWLCIFPQEQLLDRGIPCTYAK